MRVKLPRQKLACGTVHNNTFTLGYRQTELLAKCIQQWGI